MGARLPALLLTALIVAGGCAADVDEVPRQTAALFDRDLADGFLAFPWPSDTRLLDTGAPDLTAFPVITAGDVVDVYRQAVQEQVQGFGTNPLIHVRFDGPLESYGWPAAAQTLAPDSPVQLIDVDAASPTYTARIPVELHWQAADRVYVPAHTLGVRPALGWPLAPSTTYALVVLDSLVDADGLPLVRAEALQAVLAGGGDPVLAEAFAPLGPALDLAGVDRDAVAVATVFTTGQPVAELRAMRDWVADPDNLEQPVLLSYVEYGDAELYTLVGGTYSTPIFLTGDAPYASSGGGFDVTDGAPAVQRWESVEFSLTVPLAEPPAGGYPVVLALPGIDGTVFDFTVSSGARPLADLLSEPERAVAVFSFEPPLHGSRGADVGAVPDLHLVNYFNPTSMRCVLRQEALDATFALRVLRDAVSVEHPELSLDTSAVGLLGHGQGAYAGAMLAAVEPQLDPVWLNAGGGGMALTLTERTQPLDVEDMLHAAIGEDEAAPLTVFHPFAGLLQLAVEVVDPVNYARPWALGAADGEATSVLISGGLLDPHTAPEMVSNLAVAGGAPPIEPVEWGIPEATQAGLESVALPFSGNVAAADGEMVTSGLITRGNLGGTLIFECHYTAATGADFLATGLADGLPTAQ